MIRYQQKSLITTWYFGPVLLKRPKSHAPGPRTAVYHF